jgi:hypothetical protein
VCVFLSYFDGVFLLRFRKFGVCSLEITDLGHGIKRVPKVTSVVARTCCAQHLHDVRGLYMTQIEREFCAQHLRDINLPMAMFGVWRDMWARFTPDARHIRESDANVARATAARATTARNKGCYFWSCFNRELFVSGFGSLKFLYHFRRFSTPVPNLRA